MAFEPFTLLKPGDQFATRTSAQGPAFFPGTMGIMPNGDRFRYVKMGAVAGVVAKVYQGPLPVTNHVLQTAAAAPVGQTYVDLTLGATAATANQYLGGTLVVDLVSNTGFGHTYHIGAHAAVGSGGVFRVPFAGSDKQVPQSDGLMLAGSESVQVAIATTANSISVYPSPFSGILIMPGTLPTASVVGVPAVAIAAGSWGWIQTRGEAMVLTDNTTVVIGQPAICSSVTSGAVSLLTTTNVVTHPIIGVFTRIAASASYSTVDLHID